MHTGTQLVFLTNSILPVFVFNALVRHTVDCPAGNPGKLIALLETDSGGWQGTRNWSIQEGFESSIPKFANLLTIAHCDARVVP